MIDPTARPERKAPLSIALRVGAWAAALQVVLLISTPLIGGLGGLALLFYLSMPSYLLLSICGVHFGHGEFQFLRYLPLLLVVNTVLLFLATWTLVALARKAHAA